MFIHDETHNNHIHLPDATNNHIHIPDIINNHIYIPDVIKNDIYISDATNIYLYINYTPGDTQITQSYSKLISFTFPSLRMDTNTYKNVYHLPLLPYEWIPIHIKTYIIHLPFPTNGYS